MPGQSTDSLYLAFICHASVVARDVGNANVEFNSKQLALSFLLTKWYFGAHLLYFYLFYFTRLHLEIGQTTELIARFVEIKIHIELREQVLINKISLIFHFPCVSAFSCQQPLAMLMVKIVVF